MSRCMCMGADRSIYMGVTRYHVCVHKQTNFEKTKLGMKQDLYVGQQKRLYVPLHSLVPAWNFQMKYAIFPNKGLETL